MIEPPRVLFTLPPSSKHKSSQITSPRNPMLTLCACATKGTPSAVNACVPQPLDTPRFWVWGRRSHSLGVSVGAPSALHPSAVCNQISVPNARAFSFERAGLFLTPSFWRAEFSRNPTETSGSQETRVHTERKPGDKPKILPPNDLLNLTRLYMLLEENRPGHLSTCFIVLV